ncbi:MAG: hypothetical protein FJ161_01450 [Gammaproteobacteria bacterium]|nr:hypothetical protein [Gammaproteobacteria bacterium]
MKKISQILALIFAFFAFPVFATVQWSLIADKIIIESETDSYGDQLYFFIIEQHNGVADHFISVPSFPFSYTKHNLASFESVVVWTKTLEDQSDVKVIVSLFDREALPWVPDELIGSFFINFDNPNAVPHWSSMGDECILDPAHAADLKQEVNFHQGSGKYKIMFHLEKVDK